MYRFHICLLFAIFLVVFIGCSDKESGPVYYAPPNELYVRDDAASTLVPLLINNGWNYERVYGENERPDKHIASLLKNDRIINVGIYPVRRYDDNDGTGKYDYQTLCYITANDIAYFYLEDRILVGRYLEVDAFGYSSVIWDFELPTYTSSSQTRRFLNRNVATALADDFDYMTEEAGLYTVTVAFGTEPGVTKNHSGCKLFTFTNRNNNPGESSRVNKFYFKPGLGLIRYQQFLVINGAEHKLYEQDIIE